MSEVRSRALERVEREVALFGEGSPASKIQISGWRTQEWMFFIRKLPAELPEERLTDLDRTFDLSNSSNAEILHEWLLQAIRRKYKPAYPAIERFLSTNGRRKYVKSLFLELAKTPEGLQFGKEVYAKTRPLYHAVSVTVADKILNWPTMIH
jgi:hypothetical protein